MQGDSYTGNAEEREDDSFPFSCDIATQQVIRISRYYSTLAPLTPPMEEWDPDLTTVMGGQRDPECRARSLSEPPATDGSLSQQHVQGGEAVSPFSPGCAVSTGALPGLTPPPPSCNGAVVTVEDGGEAEVFAEATLTPEPAVIGPLLFADIKILSPQAAEPPSKVLDAPDHRSVEGAAAPDLTLC